MCECARWKKFQDPVCEEFRKANCASLKSDEKQPEYRPLELRQYFRDQVEDPVIHFGTIALGDSTEKSEISWISMSNILVSTVSLPLGLRELGLVISCLVLWSKPCVIAQTVTRISGGRIIPLGWRQRQPNPFWTFTIRLLSVLNAQGLSQSLYIQTQLINVTL